MEKSAQRLSASEMTAPIDCSIPLPGCGMCSTPFGIGDDCTIEAERAIERIPKCSTPFGIGDDCTFKNDVVK